MKKFLSIFLTLIILFVFSACKKQNSTPLESNFDTQNIVNDIDTQTQDTTILNEDEENNSPSPTTKNEQTTNNKNTQTSEPDVSNNTSNNNNTPPLDSSNSYDNDNDNDNDNNTPSTEPDNLKEKIILPEIIDTYQEEYRPYYMLGNCKNLKGNPLVVLLFIDDDESSWSANEVTEYTNKYVNEGLSYLEDKAKEWGVELKFSIKSYSTPLSDYTLKYEGSVIKDLRINGSSKDVLDQAAYDMGYSSNWELYSKFRTEHESNDDVIFLTFINKAGKSYTRHFISTGRTSYSEHCVLFSDYLEGDSFGCRASTVAHELLHLFGAEDFYNGIRKILAYQTYPKDIMLWMPTQAYENEIGDFTAYTIGWTDTIPQICYNEYWWK